MISLTEIKKFYIDDLHKFDRGLLREYLQYHILNICFSHKIGQKLTFLGGTALRIVYGSRRFSEDIDFDNKNLTEDEFTELSYFIKKELEKEGLLVEIKVVNKMAFHTYINFPEVLQKNELSNIGGEKILIQIDTFDQQVNYKTNTYILNKFDITKPIIVTPKEVILAQKLWTITNRKKPKGRDFFDIAFLLENTKPDEGFLLSKFPDSSLGEVKESILKTVGTFDFKSLAKDVQPFLQKSNDINKVLYFKELLKQTKLE